MDAPATADICDAHPDSVRILAPGLADYGARRAFAGPVATVRCRDDNSRVREALETPGDGRVLVVDGGGSRHCALLGGRLAAAALRNGWRGIVVWGCIRDAVELAALEIGVKALGACPRRSRKGGAGERQLPLELQGVAVRPGDYLYADRDGVLLAGRPLHPIAGQAGAPA
ncbi:MAG: ribonuclease E activity regulator RraA [Gammaproteobacteria bacterium]|nr:ribonuclease E activity regulator RraA [Gammaproteobacteria bacterium]